MPGGGFSRIPPSLDAQDDERFTLGNFSLGEHKPIKVIVIGAGFSGILAGIRCVFVPGSEDSDTLLILTC